MKSSIYPSVVSFPGTQKKLENFAYGVYQLSMMTSACWLSFTDNGVGRTN